MTQPLLDFFAVDESETLQAKFRAFHDANPAVYYRLTELAKELKRAGHAGYGMKGLFEVLRWQSAIKTSAGDGFKLNNNHTAYYARMIMSNNTELDGFFRLREAAQ